MSQNSDGHEPPAPSFGGCLTVGHDPDEGGGDRIGSFAIPGDPEYPPAAR